jgi:hypothetical protein
VLEVPLQAWIAACDDTVTWANFQFFTGTPPDCTVGVIVADIQFAGMCSRCRIE